MDVVYDGEKLDGRPDIILHTLAEMAGLESRRRPDDESGPGGGVDFEQRLLDAVGPGRHDEARSVIEIARLSWRLRDDDNVLLGRVEKQLLRAVDIAVERLQRSGRLSSNTKAGADSAAILAGALQDSTGGEITLKEPDSKSRSAPDGHENEKPRQIVGQPASPGLATATARVIRSPGDLGAFTAGEILVCDAIQPTMSHVVPLAAAIVERRGGMLIHGAIIARELGIPCVNGVSEAILSIADGEILTVDGYLGIVTIGPPEFDLETGAVTDSVRAHKPSELNKKP
jgi:pyruvate,water dikinase